MNNLPEAFTTSDSQLWMTPPELLESLKPEFNFTLDVCASAKSAQCEKYYTKEEDAFKQDWGKDAKGGDIFCNPPYGDKAAPVRDWILHGNAFSSVFLIPLNKSDQTWFHDLVLPFAEIRIIKGRVQFLDPETGLRPWVWSKKLNKMVQNGNSQGSQLIIYGPKATPGKISSHDFKRIKH